MGNLNHETHKLHEQTEFGIRSAECGVGLRIPRNRTDHERRAADDRQQERRALPGSYVVSYS
jgi:hypothetical protein